MRLRAAVPAAAMGGAAAAAVVLLVMPAASSPQRAGQAPTAVSAEPDGQVEEPEAPGLPVGAVIPGYGSARAGPAGVPLGFVHSPDGAAAAATAWLSTVEGAGVLDTRRRHDVLAAIGDAAFVSAASARLADRAAALGIDGSGQPSSGYVAATVWPARGAYRVVFAGSTAQVEIWHSYQLEVVPAGAHPAPGRWRRATIALRWSEHVRDWRITTDFRFGDGPDPETASPSPLERAEALARLGAGWRLYADGQQSQNRGNHG